MAADATENQLGISWHDSVWIPILNPTNVLEYFSQRTNPFYDRTCNNEVVKMQRLDPSALQTMSGVEYEVIHVQDPILFVIRKQHRHSATQVTPIADYYILAGVVYQAPDLCSVINSRMLSALHNFESAFTEAVAYSRYHPSKGYWWQFKDTQNKTDTKSTPEANSNQSSSLFQREGVNQLLEELAKQFPPNIVKVPPAVSTATGTVQVKKEQEDANTESETKDSTITDQNLQNSDVNGLTTSKTNTVGLVTGQKRGSDSTAKQPPQKKKRQ